VRGGVVVATVVDGPVGAADEATAVVVVAVLITGKDE
jgi:hypothetical protein